MRGELLLLLLPLVAACRDASNDTPVEPARSSLRIYGGDNQLAFDTLSKLGSPLAVLVTGDNRPVAGARVQWQVVAGEGELTSLLTGLPLTDNATTTDVNGIAAVYFRPRSLGANAVTASVSGATPVEFHSITNPALRPPDVLINAGPLFDCTGGFDPTKYWVGTDIRDTVLSASVGQRVGIRYASYLAPVCAAEFKSTAVPVGGTPFDGIIHAGETLEFTPKVAGKWTFVDAINGGAGTLTVKP